MKIVIATGIYPPAIGGIATYAEGLAKSLSNLGHEVTVVTYGEESAQWKVESWNVVQVSKAGGFLFRWLRYAEALRDTGGGSDAVIALSSVSTGMPLIFSGLKKPKRILRLGGDFFWERYTDAGGRRSLREWYSSGFGFWKLVNSLLMPPILHSFFTIVYSTEFQHEIHQAQYSALPKTFVIENARPRGIQISHASHVPFRLLFMGRFVGFKNLSSLLTAMRELPDVRLTLIGSGPLERKLRAESKDLGGRIEFRSPVGGGEKDNVFDDHDLLIIPSVTDISPNVVLEAASRCLPVLLTEETGYSPRPGISVKPLRTPKQIADAVREVIGSYRSPSYDSSARDWTSIAADFQSLLSSHS